jgi:hypothetical protein
VLKCLARSSLALLGLSMVAPSGVQAQNVAPPAPGVYPAQPGLDGQILMAPPASAAAPHKHKGKTLCARCAAAQDPRNMPPVRVISCAHSRNGACPTCQALLAMPGQVVMMGSPTPPQAPGRAVVSSGGPPPAVAGRMPAGPSDGPASDPAPIGVVRAGYANGPPTANSGAAQPSSPGRAVAEAGPGSSPYRPKTEPGISPNVIGHLFGFAGIGSGRARETARRKAEAHAMIQYNNEGPTVTDLPASAVYGRR